MNQQLTQAIVLRRINYGEADRIVTVLTPDHGKLGLVARGVRRPKSKLAGGIELFSVATIGFMKGRGELSRLTSARLDKHYGGIVADLGRLQLGYELIKLLDKITEDVIEPAYFELMMATFEALNDPSVPVELSQAWFGAQLLRLSGMEPNLQTDAAGRRLTADSKYNFDVDNAVFTESAPAGPGGFGPADIKFARLVFAGQPPRRLAAIPASANLAAKAAALVAAMLSAHLRV